MGSSARRGESDASVVRDALVVSAVKFLRESLVEILGRVAGVRVSGQAESLSDAIDIARAACPDIVLMDVAFPGGTEAAARIGAAAPEASLIALGISETEEDVIAWAEAGIAGYVPNTASVEDMIYAHRGDQPRVVRSLPRALSAACCGVWPRPGARTRRPWRKRSSRGASSRSSIWWGWVFLEQGHSPSPEYQPGDHQVQRAQSARQAQPPAAPRGRDHQATKRPGLLTGDAVNAQPGRTRSRLPAFVSSTHPHLNP